MREALGDAGKQGYWSFNGSAVSPSFFVIGLTRQLL